MESNMPLNNISNIFKQQVEIQEVIILPSNLKDIAKSVDIENAMACEEKEIQNCNNEVALINNEASSVDELEKSLYPFVKFNDKRKIPTPSEFGMVYFLPNPLESAVTALNMQHNDFKTNFNTIDNKRISEEMPRKKRHIKRVKKTLKTKKYISSSSSSSSSDSETELPKKKKHCPKNNNILFNNKENIVNTKDSSDFEEMLSSSSEIELPQKKEDCSKITHNLLNNMENFTNNKETTDIEEMLKTLDAMPSQPSSSVLKLEYVPRKDINTIIDANKDESDENTSSSSSSSDDDSNEDASENNSEETNQSQKETNQSQKETTERENNVQEAPQDADTNVSLENKNIISDNIVVRNLKLENITTFKCTNENVDINQDVDINAEKFIQNEVDELIRNEPQNVNINAKKLIQKEVDELISTESQNAEKFIQKEVIELIGNESENDIIYNEVDSNLKNVPNSKGQERKSERKLEIKKVEAISHVRIGYPVNRIVKPAQLMPKKEYLKCDKYTYNFKTSEKKPITMIPIAIGKSDISNWQYLCYEDGLNLVPIFDILKKNNIQLELTPSEVGRDLKKVSTLKISHNLYQKSIINNIHIYDAQYPLVYGAIPAKMESDMLYLINYRIKLFKDLKFKKSDEVAKTKATSDALCPFYDAEMELLMHCYWRLASTDLLKWKDDKKQNILKSILEYNVACLPETEEHKSEAANKNEQSLKEKLISYCNFGNKNHISAECLLVIKISYNLILNRIREVYRKKDEAKYRLYTDNWHAFMQRAKLHHISCPYTLKTLDRYVEVFKKKLKFQALEIETMNQKYDTLSIPFKAIHIFEILNFNKLIPNVKTIHADLVGRISTFYAFFCRLFARHIINNGILTGCLKITNEQTALFIKQNKLTLCSNAFGQSLPNITKSIKTIMHDLILNELSKYDETYKDAKMDTDVIDLLINGITCGIYKAISPVIFSNNLEILKTNTISCLFEQAIDEFLSTDEFLGQNADLWPEEDDSDIESMDENDPRLPFPKETLKNITDESYSSDESADSDYEEENYEDLMQELESLHTDSSYNPICREKKIKKNTQTTNSNTPPHVSFDDDEKPFIQKKSFVNNKYFKNLIASSTHYVPCDKLTKRVKCVMCYKSMTDKVIFIRNIKVACCISCLGNLVEDFMREDKKYDHIAIESRIRDMKKLPVAFDIVTGGFLTAENYTNDIHRTNYHRSDDSDDPRKPLKRTKLLVTDSAVKKAKLSKKTDE